MVTLSTSILVGLTKEELKKMLSEAQSAYAQLMTGKKTVSLSYSLGDGNRSVSYQQANSTDLFAWIKLLQAELGIVPTTRRPLRFRY
ncbi:gpW family head-tail joining protein (plasmid) [Orbus sturtevantii]|uniref:gpW family head-tail joining protein n=1 Tax=Orbus sturtevantii TaxID=3074109 RepID=UPI00370D5797